VHGPDQSQTLSLFYRAQRGLQVDMGQIFWF
jgi:hypothetical protein